MSSRQAPIPLERGRLLPLFLLQLSRSFGRADAVPDELAPKYWPATRARLNATELDAPTGVISVPPAAP